MRRQLNKVMTTFSNGKYAIEYLKRPYTVLDIAGWMGWYSKTMGQVGPGYSLEPLVDDAVSSCRITIHQCLP